MKVDAGGLMLVKVGLEAFLLMLLTIKDGQGVPSDIDGLLRVTVTSGAAPEAQAVPHGARTVEVYILSMIVQYRRRCKILPAR